jgi:hypothetical protein
MPDPHTLLTVDAGTVSPSPPANPACRAGAWPTPAGNTQPISTFFDNISRTPGIAKRCLDGNATKLWCGHGRQITLKRAHRGSGGTGNYDIGLACCVWHNVTPLSGYTFQAC